MELVNDSICEVVQGAVYGVSANADFKIYEWRGDSRGILLLDYKANTQSEFFCNYRHIQIVTTGSVDGTIQRRVGANFRSAPASGGGEMPSLLNTPYGFIKANTDIQAVPISDCIYGGQLLLQKKNYPKSSWDSVTIVQGTYKLIIDCLDQPYFGGAFGYGSYFINSIQLVQSSLPISAQSIGVNIISADAGVNSSYGFDSNGYAVTFVYGSNNSLNIDTPLYGSWSPLHSGWEYFKGVFLFEVTTNSITLATFIQTYINSIVNLASDSGQTSEFNNITFKLVAL